MKKRLLFFAICSALTISAQNIPSYVPSNGLVAWYPFNGNANDESGNGNNGTVYGATLTTDRDGNANSAYDFDGSGNYVEVTSSSSISMTSAYSIAVWCRADVWSFSAPIDEHAIVSKIVDGNWYGGYELYSQGNGRFSHTGNVSGNFMVTADGYSENNWHFAVCTFDGTRIKLFINGSLMDSLNRGGNIQSSNTPLRFGRRGGAGYFDCWFDGKIDDVALYNRALSAAEIQSLYIGNQPTASINSRGCVECDSLNIGEEFVLNGDSMIVVDRPMLDSIITGGHDVTKACVSHVTDMRNLLRGKGWFNQDISSWDVSNVTNMNRMFKKASAFNQDISNWDVGNVNRMTEMFYDATGFNQDLSDWCVRAFQYNAPPNFALNGALIPSHYPRWGNCPQDFDNITTLATGAFLDSNGCIDCSALNIGDYFEIGGDTLLVVDRAMLDSLVLLHDDLSKVCVSNITNMTDALRGLSWFNTDISKWDVSNVTDMSNMFWKARIFNQDIGNWDVSKVKRMNRMFKIARDFNQDIGSWDVGQVERFQEMFRNADAFNQDIGYWNVSSVLNDVQMQSMFRSADNFSQDLTNWCVSSIASKPTGFDANSPLTASQLPLWGGCPPPASNLGTDTLSICGQDSVLISARSGFDTYAWNTGETSSSIWVSQSGMYSVASTMSGQYTVDSSVYVSLVNASITASDSIVCAGDSIELSFLGTNNSQKSYAIQDEPVNLSASVFSQNPNLTIATNVKILDLSKQFNIYKQIQGGEMRLWYDGNHIIFQVKASYGNCFTSSGWVYLYGSINDNEYHKIIAVYSRTNGELSLFIDGVLQDSKSVNNGYLADCNLYSAVLMGANSFVNVFECDEIGFYNIVFDNTDIQNYLNCSILPEVNSNYISYFNFDEGYGLNSTDYGSNNLVGTHNGNYTPYSCSSIILNDITWSTGDTTASITANPTQTTTYYCTVSDGISSCTDSVTVYVNSPVVDLGADTLSVCGQDSILLDAGAGHSSYLWNTGETTQTIYADASGTYSVEVSDGTPSSNSSSLSFDGVDDFVELGLISPFNSSESISLECNFLWDGSSSGFIVLFAQNGAGNASLVVDDIGGGYGRLKGTVLQYNSQSDIDHYLYDTISANKWYHVIYSYDVHSGDLKLYVNNSLEDSDNYPFAQYYNVNNTPSRIGNYHFNSHYFGGKVESCQIVNGIVTPSSSCDITPQPNTIGYWNFEEGSGSVANDLSGNGNHGTINGASWSSDVPSQSCGLGCTATDSVYVSIVNAIITASSGSILCSGDSISLTVGNGASPILNSTSSSNLPSYLPTNGLVHFFPLNGSIIDLVGGINGNEIGSTYSIDRNGTPYSAVSLDGNDHIVLDNTFYGGNAINELSYNVWVKIPFYHDGRISGKEGYWKTISLNVKSDGGVSFGGSSSNTYFGISSPPAVLNTNQWHMVTVSLVGGILRLYVDGVEVSSGTCNASYLQYQFHAAGNSTATNYLGAIHPVSTGVTSYLTGEIDDFALWNRALSPSEIQSLYTTPPPSNLSFNWSTGDTTASITANPTQTTTYYCTVSDGITSCTDSLTVYVNNTLSLDLGADTLSVCGQDSAVIDAGAGYSSYLWSNGDSTQSITAYSSGMYSCTAGGGSCTATDSVYVSIVNASITASDSIVCAGDSVSLTIGNGASSLFNSTSSSNLPSYLPTNGLVAWYPFNGNANDESGNGNNGTVNGATLTSDRDGNANSAYDFDGAAFIDILSSNILTPAIGTQFTFSSWINPSVISGGNTILSKYQHLNPTNCSFFFMINPSGGLSLAGNGTDDFQSSPSVVSLNTWHHIAFQISNSGFVRFYVNGLALDSGQISLNSSQSSLPLRIGSLFDAGLPQFFDGQIDDIAIYNRALSPSEMLSLYNGQINSSNRSYTWSTGDTTASITANPLQTTTYYCTVSDGITSCTDSVEIKVGLMDNPADVTVDLSVADTASFSVNYLDSSTSYQWEINSVVGWLPLLDSSSFYVGGKSHLLKLRNIGTNFNGLEFRCIVTSPSCSEVSDSAILTVIGAGAMISNPISLNEAVSQFIGEKNLTPPELPVSVRPNPTTGIFYVHPFIEGTYSLIDGKGRTVERGRATPSYDLSSYPNGVYILRLTLETSTHQIRVIKQ